MNNDFSAVPQSKPVTAQCHPNHPREHGRAPNSLDLVDCINNPDSNLAPTKTSTGFFFDILGTVTIQRTRAEHGATTTNNSAQHY